MLIVDSQIHLWENARMSPAPPASSPYSVHDALQEMAVAGIDATGQDTVPGHRTRKPGGPAAC